jgi:hypothetical protein
VLDPPSAVLAQALALDEGRVLKTFPPKGEGLYPIVWKLKNDIPKLLAIAMPNTIGLTTYQF